MLVYTKHFFANSNNTPTSIIFIFLFIHFYCFILIKSNRINVTDFFLINFGILYSAKFKSNSSRKRISLTLCHTFYFNESKNTGYVIWLYLFIFILDFIISILYLKLQWYVRERTGAYIFISYQLFIMKTLHKIARHCYITYKRYWVYQFMCKVTFSYFDKRQEKYGDSRYCGDK